MKKNTALYFKIASGVIIVIGVVLLVMGIGAGSGVVGVGGVIAIIGVVMGKAADKPQNDKTAGGKKKGPSIDDDNGSSSQVIFPEEEQLLTLTANGRSFNFRHMALVVYKGKIYSVMHLAERVPELEGMVDDDTYFVFLVTKDEEDESQEFTFVSDEVVSASVVAKYEKYKR